MMIDELVPAYEVCAKYGTLVQASAAQTSAALQEADFSRLPVTTLLMKLRTLGRRRSDVHSTQAERLRRAGFVQLALLPQKEVVFGIVGRFWRPDSGILKDLTAEQVIAFHTVGYAKAVWNFAVTAESEQASRVTTETRIQAFGRSARWKFRAYWLVIGFFSGLIRKEMLAMVKRNAEQAAKTRY
ncbi:MAG TPA: hypothetical protein VEH30_17985 [Terriglobales bacterium]|nr:hypothetical protein [Terriglobales bacterium]